MLRYQFGPYAAVALDDSQFESPCSLFISTGSPPPGLSGTVNESQRRIVWVRRPLNHSKGRILGYCLQGDTVRLIVRTPQSASLQWIRAERLLEPAQARNWLRQQDE